MYEGEPPPPPLPPPSACSLSACSFSRLSRSALRAAASSCATFCSNHALVSTGPRSVRLASSRSSATSGCLHSSKYCLSSLRCAGVSSLPEAPPGAGWCVPAPAPPCSLPLVAATPFSSQHAEQNHEKHEMSHALLASRPKGADGGFFFATSFRCDSAAAAAAWPSSARPLSSRPPPPPPPPSPPSASPPSASLALALAS
mmetsp:Transcript_48474/g.116597  ORF Transcript_48474/g.116597 Transcript_48474/m.116597 type:complete len:200 (+) Transcript_48474:1111-1710(+)